MKKRKENERKGFFLVKMVVNLNEKLLKFLKAYYFFVLKESAELLHLIETPLFGSVLIN